ncbi:MAG: DEAD/DEAH box helicase [Buchananella hordeovulneris]|nr:DEAD/DEAH box helicase [Buchananella hordeovulneris]
MSYADAYAAARERSAWERSQAGKFAAFLDFELDDFQREGIAAIESGAGVLVAAPTGAGKTVVGEFACYLALARGKRAFYTTPIKALSNQKYNDLVATYGAQRVGLLTGDTSINGEAPLVVMTTEVLRNMLYSQSRAIDDLGFVVMDEVHYLADRFRGPVWEEVIIHLPQRVQLVSLSATVSNAEEFGAWLNEVRGQTKVVVSEVRPVPLWQHMMVGSRLFDLYSYRGDATEASRSRGGAVGDDVPTAAPSTSTAAPQAAARTTPAGRPVLNSKLVQAAAKLERPAPGGFGARGKPGSRGRARSRSPRLNRAQMVNSLEEKGLLPAIVFVFSRSGCDQAAREVLGAGIRLTSRSEREEIDAYLDKVAMALPPADLAAVGFDSFCHGLREGVAAHHAGLLPLFKETVEHLFTAGLVKLVFATETLALGINMPARTVVIESLRKWDGSGHVQLTPGEYTQLTGRAGRRGIDVEGHAVVLAGGAATPEVVSTLASKRTYPLHSAFQPTFNMAVNLLSQLSMERAQAVLRQSFAQFQADRSVVSVARQVRTHEEAMATAAPQMACHLGEFGEYALMRDELATLEKEGARERSYNARQRAEKTLWSVQRGDVISFRSGRHRMWAVVLEHVPTKDASPVLSVIGEDARTRRVGLVECPAGVEKLGRVRLPKGSLRRPAERAEIAKMVREVGRAALAGPKGDDVAAAGPQSQAAARSGGEAGGAGETAAKRALTTEERIAELKAALRAHPCHGCAEREEHARQARRWLKARKERDRLLGQVDRRTGGIVAKFDKVCVVLSELGYLAAGKVTAAGASLARIYCEKDLLVSECLRAGIWEKLTPAELAGVLSACVFEPRGTFGGGYPRGNLQRALQGTEQVARAVSRCAQRAGLDPLETTEPGIAAAVTQWAEGARLSDALAESEVTPGDFVRWVKQVMDLADQLTTASPTPELAMTARAAHRALNRGVVAWSGL